MPPDSRIKDVLDDILTLTSGMDTRVDALEGNQLASGVSTIPREIAAAQAAVTLTSGRLQCVFFTSAKSFTAAQVRAYSGNVAAGATPTLVRFGLYSVDGAGAGTLIASTPNDTTLFATINTQYVKAFSAPVAVTQGTRYALGMLCVTGATAPVVPGAILQSFAASGSTSAAFAPRIAGAWAGQTDLPASFTDADLSTALAGMIYAAVIPA